MKDLEILIKIKVIWFNFRKRNWNYIINWNDEKLDYLTVIINKIGIRKLLKSLKQYWYKWKEEKIKYRFYVIKLSKYLLFRNTPIPIKIW